MNKKIILIFTSLTVLFMLACNATFTVGYPTPTIEPPTAVPTSTDIPLSGQVTLVSQPYIETSQDPAYTMTAQIPQLSGSDDPRVGAFNQMLNAMVQNEVDVFRTEFTRGPFVEVSAASYLEVTYDLVSQYGDIWSIKFFYNFYTNGAAHPGDYSHTVNYDLSAGRELGLSDLFLPGSNYLETVSNYCIAELSKQPFFDGGFSTGVDPTTDNYRNWNITSEGLVITFDTYQVAPGAAGPQVVTIPFEQLRSIIDSQGPLKELIQ